MPSAIACPMPHIVERCTSHAACQGSQIVCLDLTSYCHDSHHQRMQHPTQIYAINPGCDSTHTTKYMCRHCQQSTAHRACCFSIPTAISNDLMHMRRLQCTIQMRRTPSTCYTKHRDMQHMTRFILIKCDMQDVKLDRISCHGVLLIVCVDRS